MKNRHYFFSFFIIIIFLIIILYSFKNFSNFESTDNAYVRGSITTISSRIEGYVIEVPGVLNTEINLNIAYFKTMPGYIKVIQLVRNSILYT